MLFHFALLVALGTVVGTTAVSADKPARAVSDGNQMSLHRHVKSVGLKHVKDNFLGVEEAKLTLPSPSLNDKHSLSTYASTGSVVVSYTADASCSDIKLFYEAPVNTCITEDEGYALKFFIEEGSNSCEDMIVKYYSDKTCTTEITTSSWSFSYDGCLTVPSSFLSGFGVSYYTTTCQTEVAAFAPATAAVISSTEGDTGCGDVVDRIGYADGLCLDASSLSVEWDCATGTARQTTYSSSQTCTGSSSSTSLGTTCQISDDDDDDDDGDDDFSPAFINTPPSASGTPFPTTTAEGEGSYQWACVDQSSIAPTASPTLVPTAPTAMPTAEPTAPTAMPTPNPTPTPGGGADDEPSTAAGTFFKVMSAIIIFGIFGGIAFFQ